MMPVQYYLSDSFSFVSDSYVVTVCLNEFFKLCFSLKMSFSSILEQETEDYGCKNSALLLCVSFLHRSHILIYPFTHNFSQ